MRVARRRSRRRRAVDLDTLDRIQRRVLWLAVRMVDHANRERPRRRCTGRARRRVRGQGRRPHGVERVDGRDHDVAVVRPPQRRRQGVGEAARVAGLPRDQVPDRASSTARTCSGCASAAGCRATRRRTKDPGRVDFSTGSVGLGAVAPLFAVDDAALHRRALRHGARRPASSRSSVTPSSTRATCGRRWPTASLQGLGNVMWVVDANRQSLDRVIPGQKIKKLMEFFEGSGWHVVEAKWGRLLQAAFARAGRRRAAPPHRPDEQRGVPVAVRAARRGSAAGVPARRGRVGAPVRRRHPRRRARAARAEPRRPRPRRAARRVPRSATR